MAEARRVSVPAVIGGGLFIAIWLAAAVTLGALKLMGGLMANDSGAASGNAHLGLLAGLMGGQLLTGLAGIPAGLAFFWQAKRKVLLWTFAVMLVTGIAVQVAAFYSFAS